MKDIIPPEPGFRWRGAEVTRLEGFSDAVFAFSVTLLVVSVEVGRTRRSLIDNAAMVAVGVLSIPLAVTLPPNLVGLAGYFYFVIPVYFMIPGAIFGSRERVEIAKA